jgi:hypothetical protein
MTRDDSRTPKGNRFAVAGVRDAIERRKARHAEIVQEAGVRSAWVTSVPGSPEVTFDCLPDSAFPEDMRSRGRILRDEGDGQRILATAITERFARRADGELEPVTAESTRPIAETRTHAGIVKVKRYAFEMP